MCGRRGANPSRVGHSAASGQGGTARNSLAAIGREAGSAYGVSVKENGRVLDFVHRGGVGRGVAPGQDIISIAARTHTVRYLIDGDIHQVRVFQARRGYQALPSQVRSPHTQSQDA